MSSIRTESVSGKLEKVIDFRVGEFASKRHPLVPKKGMVAATDGTSVFLPETMDHFTSERNNELALANFTAHESDHIAEYAEYFGKYPSSFVETGSGAVAEYNQRNYSALTENPALAGWIDNIVKDHRIDTKRRETLPGVDRFFTETLKPAMRYLRPSVRNMSDLDAFREQFLQKTFMGETVEPVPQERRQLLDELVKLARSSDSIYQDPEIVTQIYQKIKENFDIKQKINRLPTKFNTGDHSRTDGTPQQGYQGQVQQREGRNPNEPKPKQLDESGKNLYNNDEDTKDKKGKSKDEKEDEATLDERGREELYKRDRNALYRKITSDRRIEVSSVESSNDVRVIEAIRKNRMVYGGEIEIMRRTFRQLKLKHYGTKRDTEGAELDFEAFMQEDLESRVTGVKRDRRIFIKEVQSQQRPAWAVLADVSNSTGARYFNIIDQIRATLFIQGEALSVSDYPFGLFTFSESLYVIKDFNEKYTLATADKIMSIKSLKGTSLGHCLYAVGDIIQRQPEQPKGITIVTDGQANDMDHARNALTDLYKRKIHPFLIVIGRNLEGYAKNLTRNIGQEHYSVVERDKLHELPGEMFRLFKTYGISR